LNPGVPSRWCWTTPQGVGSPISWVISLSKIRDPTQPPVILPSRSRAGWCCRFERRSRTACTACPTWLRIKVGPPARSAIPSPARALLPAYRQPEAENPEFPCAWKQLLKFLPPNSRRVDQVRHGRRPTVLLPGSKHGVPPAAKPPLIREAEVSPSAHRSHRHTSPIHLPRPQSTPPVSRRSRCACATTASDPTSSPCPTQPRQVPCRQTSLVRSTPNDGGRR
jgi:hypothetical protein